jgi:hypothetical protein
LKNDESTKNNGTLDYLLALADRYDQLGLYDYADDVLAYIKQHFVNLPMETKLRLDGHSDGQNSLSMSETESSKGSTYLRGGMYAYMSGKGQAAYRDRIPSSQYFV